MANLSGFFYRKGAKAQSFEVEWWLTFQVFSSWKVEKTWNLACWGWVLNESKPVRLKKTWQVEVDNPNVIIADFKSAYIQYGIANPEQLDLTCELLFVTGS